jgi:hypothetical protein
MGMISEYGNDMARIEGDILIDRPVDVAFDYVADQSNEPQYNSPDGAGRKDHRGGGLV